MNTTVTYCVCGHTLQQHRTDQKRRRCSIYSTDAGTWQQCDCRGFTRPEEAA